MMREFTKTILLTFIALACLTALFWNWEGFASFSRHYALHLLVLSITFGLGAGLTLWSLRAELFIILTRQKSTPVELRKPLSRFFRSRSQELSACRDKLLSPTGCLVSESELKAFVAACFEANRNRSYIGTDSNVPTVFYHLYPTYLEQQKANVVPGRDARILLATEEQLSADFQRDQTSRSLGQSFYDSHTLQHIRLLQVDPAFASTFANAHAFPATDIGIFGWRFVVFFKPVMDAHRNPFYVIHMEVLNQERRAQLRDYLVRLNDNAKEIAVSAEQLVCIVRDKAKRDSDSQRLTKGAK